MTRTFGVLVSLVALACHGGSSSGDGDDDEGDEVGGTTDAADTGDTDGIPPSGAAVPTPSRHWRLSWAQYDRAMSELVGADVAPSVELGFPREIEGFAGWLNQSVSLEASDGIANALEDAALAHAPAIVANLPSCGASDTSCVDDLVRTFGKRAWRRPLSDEEATRYAGLFAAVAEEIDAPTATESVVEAMIRSPYFVFRSEAGDEARVDGEDVRLTPHEIASALSFGLWGAPPDAMLIAAADEGSLEDPAEIEAHAQRLLDDPRFIDEFYPFVSQWLGFYDVANVTKDAAFAPEFDPAVAAAMQVETRALLDDLAEAETLSYQQLLTATHTFPPAELDWIYGMPTSGARIDTPERMGILMQPSFLATHAGAAGTSPTKRGVFVVRRMACFDPPLPPDDLVAMNPEPDPDATTRELFERHSQDPGCAACHIFFDPLGMAFENFDAAGRYRTTENGLPVDASGVIAPGILQAEEIQVADARDLALSLAESPIAQQCFVRKAFQYFHGREDLASDQPILDDAYAAFVASSFDVRELLLAFVRRPEFALRRTSP
jgi:hypothetical protein